MTKHLSFVLICIILTVRLPALSFFVSPTGDDANPGTVSAPFATITGARAAICALKGTSGLPSGGIYVWLAAGTYDQSASLQFESQDSGTAACPIVYQAEPGQQVYITGGQKLDPSWFAPVDSTSPVWLRLDPSAQGNVYAVNLAAHGITDYGTLKPGGYLVNTIAPMELFCNGRPMTLGRWPNADQPFASTVSAPSSNQITYSGTRPSRWTQAQDVWLHGFWENTFADYHVPVTSINTAAQTITFQNTPAQFSPAAGHPYYAYNLLEEIDEPGEYYIDRTAGILYFWPPAPIAGLLLQVSMMEPSVVRFDGTEYVTLSDLNFEVSRGPLLMINAGDHIRVERCRFRNSGEYAVQILGSNNGLDQCEIVDCGEDGVRMAGGVRASLTAGNNYVTNCRIHQVARINWGCHPGINFFDGCGNLAANNLIDEIPHLAILFAGNNQIIQYNEIRHVCLLTSDSGAIYSGRDWGYRGNRIQFNYLHHIASSQPGYGTSGVYLDDLMSSATVTSNVFYDVSGGAIFCGGGRDNIMTNNIIAGCGMAHYNGDYARPDVSNVSGSSWNLLQRLAAEGIQYQQNPWASAYPACAAIPNSWAQIETGSWRNPQGCVFNSNAGWANTNWLVETDVSGTGVFAVYASMANNNPAISPLFDDAAALDRSLRPAQIQAPVTGSQPIPFGSIGRNTQGQPAPTFAPPVPVLTSTAVTNGEVDLAWTDYGNLPCEQEAGFELQRRNEPNGAWEVITSFGPDVDFCTSTGLVPSTVYSYRVRVFNAAGSVFSNSVTVTTLGPDYVPGAGTPIEAESSMTIVTNIGQRGNIGVVYAALASRQSVVSLFDPGDDVRIPFNVAVTGTYRLGVRLRAGDSNVPLGTSYWPNGYSFNLDGSSLPMGGDPSTLSPVDNSMGTVYWGTMYSGAVTLNAGEHTLDVISNHLWAALDYIEVDPFVPPPPPVTFAGWQQIHFSADQLTESNISGWSATPASDGLSNLFKYAVGLDPWTTTTGSEVQISTADGEPQLSYSRPVGLTDVTYVVEVSNDQTLWTALPQIDLGVTDGFDAEQATDSGPPHLFIRLRVVSGMGVSSTPALPAGSAATRFEVESPLTVVTDLNTRGTVGVLSDPNASGGQFVRLFDAGDAIRVSFLSGFGSYHINVRVRAGDAGGQTEFWPNGYYFTLDGKPLALVGNSTTLSPPDLYYPTTYWGTMSSAAIPLSAGMHTLLLTANRNWSMVDYVEIASP
jgi:hypothetical protein